MKDSSLSRRRRIKLKLLVSFNGAFRRRPPSRKLRYVGGETRIISVDRNTSFQILKSKIAHLICPGLNFVDFGLKYHVSESFCGDNGKQQGPVLGLLESDDDLRCMIEEYETELEGKLRTRLWIFVCNANDGFDDTVIVDKYSAENVNGDWFCWKNNGFVKLIGVVSDGDDIRKIENPFCLIHKYENKSKKFGDDSLRKMVLKQLLLSKKLNGIPSFCSNREESVTELASENGISQPPPQQLCSELGSPWSSESKNLNFGGDPYGMNMIDCKRTNGPIGDIEGSGKILPVAESNSDSLNSKDGNSHMRCRGSNGRLLGQSRIIFGNCNGHYMLSSNRFVAVEKLQRVSFNSSINWMANGSDPNCELGTVDLASFNIVPRNGDCNMVKRRIVPPICHYPLDSDTNPMESLQITGSQWRAYGGCIRNHIFGPSEVRIRRASPYHISTQINVSELGEHKKFRLDGKTWRGRFYLRFWASSNISSQCPSTTSQSAGPGNALPGSHCYQTRGKQGTIDDGCMLNPPYCGEERLLKPVAHIVPKQGITNLDNSHVACAGNGEPVLPISNSLLDARAADVYLDILISLGIEKIDDADETLGEISLHIVGMGGQTPLTRIEEQHSNNQSNSLHSPCKSIVTELCSENRLLDVESGHETLDIHQGGAKELKNNGASDVDLSSHNLTLESDGKVQLPVCYARGHISETSLKSQSNGLALMDEQCINQGSNEMSGKCDDDDDKTAAVQHSRKSDSSSAEKDKNKKTISCLKGNDGIPADIIALCVHLATKELQIIKNADLEYIKELGNGTYGTVYHGKWKGSDVAIKRIKPSCFSNGAKEEDRLVADFWKEAHTLGQLHHPNIVALYGVVTDGPVNCLATVTEYMVNGSLKQVLCRKDRTIDRRKRMIIAMDAAFGMEYLHGKNIVHFDLKSHNFLVNMRDPQRPVCKIGDLGLSKVKQRTLVSGGIRGTIPWMAPELLRGRNLVSEKVDVFSFGIVMWELLTCEEPYANMRSEEIVAGIIRGNLRPEIPSWCDPSWRSLMERCWSSDPDCRPSFSEVAKELRAMAASMNIK